MPRFEVDTPGAEGLGGHSHSLVRAEGLRSHQEKAFLKRRRKPSSFQSRRRQSRALPAGSRARDCKLMELFFGGEGASAGETSKVRTAKK